MCVLSIQARNEAHLTKFEVGTLEVELIDDWPKNQASYNLQRVSASASV